MIRTTYSNCRILSPGACAQYRPKNAHVAIETQELPRLGKAFAVLAHSRPKRPKKRIAIEISEAGSISIEGHVFLHHAKVSHTIHEELRRHGLLIEGFADKLHRKGLSDLEDFLVVDEGASSLILSGIAGNISRRTGLDTITDKPIPFALNALNNLGLAHPIASDGAEGALLSSMVSLLVPSEIATLKMSEYRELREAHEAIRNAFKGLTAELARVNRLNRIQDPRAFSDQVETAPREFFNEPNESARSPIPA